MVLSNFLPFPRERERQRDKESSSLAREIRHRTIENQLSCGFLLQLVVGMRRAQRRRREVRNGKLDMGRGGCWCCRWFSVVFSGILLSFLLFSKRGSVFSKGVHQPIEQKLRKSFLSKGEKPIVFAQNLAQIWRSFCLWHSIYFNCYGKIIKMLRQRPLLLAN